MNAGSHFERLVELCCEAHEIAKELDKPDLRTLTEALLYALAQEVMGQDADRPMIGLAEQANTLNNVGRR